MQGDARLASLNRNPPRLSKSWVKKCGRDNSARGPSVAIQVVPYRWYHLARVVDGGVTATGVLSRQRGNLITIVITHY